MRLPAYSDETRKLARLLAGFDRNIRVLDVGCGTGRNLELLRSLAFSRIRGVDENQQLVAGTRARGFDCVTTKELGSDSYDLLILSHIVEHFSPFALLDFLASYLERLRPGGHLVVVTPLPDAVFYNDFDHVRPYLPLGFQTVYGPELAQVQFQAPYVLELQDIHFYRDQFRLQYYRRFYLSGANPLPLWVNRALKLVFFLSRGLVGRRAGWMGLYRYGGRRDAR